MALDLGHHPKAAACCGALPLAILLPHPLYRRAPEPRLGFC